MLQELARSPCRTSAAYPRSAAATPCCSRPARPASTRSTAVRRWPRWPDSGPDSGLTEAVALAFCARLSIGRGGEDRVLQWRDAAVLDGPFVVLAGERLRPPARNTRPRPPSLPRDLREVGGQLRKPRIGREIAQRPRVPAPERVPAVGRVPGQVGVEVVGQQLPHTAADLSCSCTASAPSCSRAARSLSCRTSDCGDDAVIGKQLPPEDARPPELVLRDQPLQLVGQRLGLASDRSPSAPGSSRRSAACCSGYRCAARSRSTSFSDRLRYSRSHMHDVKKYTCGNWSSGVCTFPITPASSGYLATWSSNAARIASICTFVAG